MKRISWVLISTLIILTGCNLLQGPFSKKVIQHPAPEIKMDHSYFENLGCFNDPACLPDSLRELEHPIDYISRPNDLLGGLNPSLPLAVASTNGFRAEDELQAVYVNSCMVQQYIRYLILINGELELIDSVEKLAAIYAPIESENEALSYAIAATGLSALYDLDQSSNLKWYSDTLEETYVSKSDGGYRVHLFDTFLCGCGPHIVRSVDLIVSNDGSIKSSDAIDAYSDPELDGLCID